MRRLALVGLASLSAVATGGFLAGCGDNLAKRPTGGTGGTGGSDGATGDRVDMTQDRGDAGDTGGAGGTGDGSRPDTDGSVVCPAVSFVRPTNMAMLTAADDASGMSCAGGFKYNVMVSVTAANGTTVELHGAVAAGTVTSPPLLATGTVMGNQVAFQNVQLSEGMTVLSVEIGGVPCTPTVTVSVSCNLPTCTISAPSHDTLNGVPVPDGDRASSPGSDYQAAFTVTTNIEDGQPVALTVTSTATPPAAVFTVTANAMSGVATFAGVTLKPDGQYRIAATCTNKANAVGHSMNATYTVDSTPPSLIVDQPMNGAIFGPTDLTNGTFKVCASTASADAVNLPPSAGTSASNLCVTRGQSVGCVPVTAVGVSTCLNVACPGGAPFDLTISLSDAAGNPTRQTITGITCASTLPVVSIVAPLTDAPNFADVAKRLLAATAPMTQALKDANGATAGAQTTVVACTDTMGGSARLFTGHRGDPALTALGAAVTVVAAMAADGCPNGLGFVARFTGVTLPESTEAADGALTAATEIRVDVADPVTTVAVGTSGPTDLWVDSIAPTLTEKTPTPLCGSTQGPTSPSTTFTTDVALNSSTAVVTLNITNGTTAMFGPPTYVAGTPTGVATFTAVAFPQGQNVVATTATEPSGNTASLTPPIPMPTCTVTVGTAPVVTFTSPAPGKNLCANGNALTTCIADSTAGTAGWQGNVTVHVTSGAAPLTTGNVTFTIAGGAPQTAALDASGNATLTGVTIADGAAVVLTATSDNVAGQGVGTASETVIVDTLPPLAPTGLGAVVASRRQTSFTLTWTSPADANGTTTVSDYDIRYSTAAITDVNFAMATGVAFGGSPKVPGQIETLLVSNLYIETAYNFAVAAIDLVGNRGPSMSFAAPVALFNSTLLANPTGAVEDFGFFTDGTGDFGAPGAGGFTNDKLADLLVGTQVGQHAYIYFGKAAGYSATPDVSITGPAARRFGASVINAGDLDGDNLADLAIGAPGTVAGDPAIVYIFSRKAAPWAVAGGWPATLDASQASYTITGDASYSLTFFGFAMARLGNFDGTGRGDLAISAFNYSMATGANAGRVVIVKGSDTFASIMLPDATNTNVIDGEAAADRFGRAVEILADNTLVVSAANASALAGKLYAFRWPLAATQTAGAGTASDISILGTANAQYGLTLGTLGPLGSSAASVIAAAPGTAGNFVDVQLASAADGTFIGASGSAVVPSVRFTSTAGTAFGATNIGLPPFSTAVLHSLIGNDLVPDLVIAGQADPTNAIYIVSGSIVPSLTGTVDLATSNTVGLVTLRNKLPAGWTAYGPGGLVGDVDGDTYTDFVVGESGTTRTGRALVFW